jgi:hypothetical protein
MTEVRGPANGFPNFRIGMRCTVPGARSRFLAGKKRRPSDAGDLQLFYRGALEELLQSNRNLEDLKAGKRLDSMRAIAVFTRGGFRYLPHMEFSSIGPDRPGDSFR